MCFFFLVHFIIFVVVVFFYYFLLSIKDKSQKGKSTKRKRSKHWAKTRKQKKRKNACLENCYGVPPAVRQREKLFSTEIEKGCSFLFCLLFSVFFPLTVFCLFCNFWFCFFFSKLFFWDNKTANNLRDHQRYCDANN